MMMSDQQWAQRHFENFNPDGAINPHDVDQSGSGQFMRVGRFDPLKSSVQGGPLGHEAEMVDQRPRGNVQAIQRVKGRQGAGGSTDFLERLALAEANDGAANIYSGAEAHAAGARVKPMQGEGTPRRGGASPARTPASRAAQIMAKHQHVADEQAMQQQERARNSMIRQGMLPADHRWDTLNQGMHDAAGGKSKALKHATQATAQQQHMLHRNASQQHMQHQYQRQQQAQAEEQQRQISARNRAMKQQQMRQQQQMQSYQQQEAFQQQQKLAHQQQQQAIHEQNFKRAWAKNRANQITSNSNIMFG